MYTNTRAGNIDVCDTTCNVCSTKNKLLYYDIVMTPTKHLSAHVNFFIAFISNFQNFIDENKIN